MKRILIAAGLLAAVMASAAVPAESLGLLHFQLNKSAPEAGATVHQSPSEVRLWFSQEPQDGSTSIRLINAGGQAVSTGAVVQDEADAKVFSVAVSGTLAAGTYTVSWRALGQDGHVVRDTFEFTVAAHE